MTAAPSTQRAERWRRGGLVLAGMTLACVATAWGVAPWLQRLWRTNDAKLAVGLHVSWLERDGLVLRHTQLDPAHPAVWDPATQREIPIPTDPWDRPWGVRGAAPRATVYSLGPDGADAGGAGDDVILLSPRQSIYIDKDFNARVEIYEQLPWLLGSLALLIVGAVASAGLLPKQGSPRAELALGLTLSAPLGVFCAYAYRTRPGLPHTLNLLGEQLVPVTLAPPAWGTAGALCLAVLGGVLALRLRRRERASAAS